MRRIVKCLLSHTTVILSYIFVPISFILWLLGFRLLDHGCVIGNLCTQIDAYAKEIILGRIPRYKYIMHTFDNSYFCRLWRGRFLVIPNRFTRLCLSPFLSLPWLKFGRPYYSEYPNESFYAVNRLYYEKYPAFSRKNAMLKLPENDEKTGWKILEQIGISPSDWFVCFYAREPGYYDEMDQKTQGVIRNVNVETYEDALCEVIKRGGWCIRIGSPKMKPLPNNLSMSRVIDYPKSKFVSDFMDVFLLSNCRFMITCSSGISMMPGLFGIPIVMTNVIPMHIAKPMYPKDIAILKRYHSRPLMRDLTFREALSFYMTDQTSAYYYNSLSLDVIDNSKEEIFQATKEMLDRLEDKYTEPDDYLNLQNKFSECIPPYLFCKDGCGNLGYSFLKSYEHLLI